MGIREDVLALAEELDGVSVKESCEACLASGTDMCRGDLECVESAHKACAKRLREIAEHDADDATTVSAYDLLSEEDREALAWVREMGGIERCEAFVHQGAMEHGYLLKIAHALGTSIYDGTDNADALLEKLSERLMPEGMEWPTVDGEPVVIGERMRSCGIEDCKVVGIDPANARLFLAFNDTEKGKAVYFPDLAKDCHRPAPKVLDADGVEIRLNDKVYDQDGTEWRVNCIPEPGDPSKIQLRRSVKPQGSRFVAVDPKTLTHERPVLDADGVPIREGDTVYVLGFGEPLTVKGFTDDGRVLMSFHDENSLGYKPSKLTHEQPDDWSRWREDLELSPVEYADRYRVGRFGHEELDTYRDLVRRARKLAEKESR